MAAWVGYKGGSKGGKKSWIERGLTVEEAMKEAMTPQKAPKNLGDFAVDIGQTMHGGFDISALTKKG